MYSLVDNNKHIWVAITVCASVLCLIGLDGQWLFSFNHAVGHAFIDMRQEWLNPIVERYTWFGNTLSQMMWFCLLAVVLYMQRRRSDTKWVLATGVAIGLTVSVMKHLVAYARPDWGLPTPDSYSFPSGHSAGMACFATLFYRCYPSKIVQIIALIAALAMGLSRLYLGVHWASDVIVGWLIGLTIALYTPIGKNPGN